MNGIKYTIKFLEWLTLLKKSIIINEVKFF